MRIVPSKPTGDLRRLGTILLLGMIAGAGVRYVTSRVAATRPANEPSRLIDWERARQVALRVSQWELAGIPDRAARRAQYARLVDRSEPLIAEYLNVRLPEPINRVYVVDRREWLEANFASFKVLFEPVEQLYEHIGARGSISSAMGQINGVLVGAQMGILLGFIARRVLGQYDLSLLSPDPEVRGTLYFVEPNIARVQTQLGLSDEDFRLWIALHEVTHVFQFEAYPWVRPYFNDLLRRFLEQVSSQLEALGVGLPQLLGRLVQGRSSGRHWIERMLTPEQQRIFDQLQALMSLVEGYSNHIMNAIGGQLLPSFHLIEQRIQQRQQNRPLLEELFNRITGMDLKLAQYQQGEAFVNAVAAERGVAFVNQVWDGPEKLPTMAEIREPRRWIARMGG